MKIKKLVLIFLVSLMVLGCISSTSAGWFDNKVESDNYKFDCPDDYHQDSDAVGMDGREFILLTDDSGDYKIMVSEVSKENYTDFIQREYKNESAGGNFNSNQYTFTSGRTVLKDVKEGDLRIVSISQSGIYGTFSDMEKDGYYYQVQIQHPPNDDVLDKDVQIIKDIHNSLERK